MKLDPSKLSDAKQRGDKLIAACPACREQGGDTKGDHLCVFPNGHFACAAYQKDPGHSARILQLAGIQSTAPAYLLPQAPQLEDHRPIDWTQDCQRLAQDASFVARIAKWRNWPESFVSALAAEGSLGLYSGRPCFPIRSKGGIGDPVGRHVFSWPEERRGPNAQPDAWFSPAGAKPIPPMVLASQSSPREVAVFESQWDALSVRLALGDECPPMVITRGAAPSDVLREALSEAQSVTFWMQRDVPKRDGTIPSEQWLVRCQKLLPESVRQGRRVDPPAGFKDWNDALWELSPDAFRDVVALADKEGRALESLGRSGLSNNQPVPLPDALLPVPAFDPDHLLPPVLRDYVVDGAERVQVDPAFVAIPLIVSIGSLMGNRIFLRPKLNDDWGECPNVWGAIVGRPSTLKSPAMSHAMRPLHSLQNAANAAHKEAMAGFRKEAAVGEIKRQAAKQEALKAARKGDEIDGELLVEEENQAPAGRRFVTSDPGPEALHQLLCQPENAHGILIFQDELTGVLARMADQERGAVLRVLMLAGWNGNQSFVVDRIGRGLNLQVSKCCVSVLGGIQPGKLAPLIDGAVRESVDDDGWVQRLSLLVWPDPIKEYKALDNAPNRAAFDAVMGLLAKLEATPGDGFPGAVFDDGQQQHFLRLSPEASTVFVQWVVDETNALRQGEQLAAVESHFFKMRKTVLALALIFHVALEWDTPKVSLSCLNLALRWCDYLKAHAMRVYGSSRSSCSATAERILRKLRSGDLPATFTARDLKRRAWSGLTDAKTIESALELLADHGWLTEVARPTGGRWTTDYTAHPTVFEKPSERTAKTDKRAFGSFGSDQTRHSQTK